MAIKSVLSTAPTRIDLAGGTVDIWPLYLFLNQPTTLNLAIDLLAEARLEVSERARASSHSSTTGGTVRLRSEDQGAELAFGWDELEKLEGVPPQLELPHKLLRYFAQKKAALEGSRDFERLDLSIHTRARSPAGAGLGGSSALNVAIIGALASWQKDAPIDPASEGAGLVDIARDVETTVIKVPAGMQDYYGAMFGGLQSLRWQPGAHERDWLPRDTLDALGRRLLLFYSGQSRNSGINNWALFKGFIDHPTDEMQIRSKFQSIVDATRRLEQALRAKDWVGAARAIDDEWRVRRTLAPGITTPAMDKALEAAAEVAPIAGKVCGAGGGGCFFVYSPVELSVDQRRKIEDRVRARSADSVQPLPFHVAAHGLEVQITRA